MEKKGRSKSTAKIIQALIVILVMTASYGASLTARGFVTDSQFKITENSTLVSSMKQYSIIGPRDLSVIEFIPGQEKLLAAGTGYVALIDLTAEPPDVIWAYSIIGKATALAVDDYYSPGWFVVGTDSGEVLAINAKNPDFRVSYFTAARKPIQRLGVGTLNGESTLYVLDIEGYVYIYKLPEPGWFEIGDNPQNGPIGSIPNLTIHDASMPVTFKSNGYWYNGPSRLAAIVENLEEGAYGSVVLYPYYVDKNGELKPAVPEEPTELNGNENLTVEAHLYYGIVYYPYNFTTALNESGNASISASHLYPVKQSIFAAYIVTVKNKVNGEIVNSTCYSGVSGVFSVKPGKTLNLGRLVLEEHGETITDCMEYHGISLMNETSLDLLLAVRTYTLPTPNPSYGPNGDAWMTLLLEPKNLPGVGGSYLFQYFQYESRPESWPSQATGLLVMGVDRYVYLYLVDSQLYPQEISTPYKYVEVVDVGSSVTSVASSPNGADLFIGTSSGQVYWLEWNSTLNRYLTLATLQVDSQSVTKVSFLEGGYLLVTTASGRIQLVEIAGNELIPLWRGPYGYDGIETGLQGLIGEAFTPNLIVASALQSQKSVFYLLRLSNLDIIRVAVASNILYLTPEGSKAQALPTGSKLEVYDAATGELVAVVPANTSNFYFYLQSGNYIFNFYVPGLGYISKNVTVQFPEYKEEIDFALREIVVKVRVPPPAENETYPANITTGPIANAIVSLNPILVEPSLGLNVKPYPLTGVTGRDGEVTFYVWDGVSYNLTVKASGFKNYTTSIPSWGPQIIDVALKPEVKKEVATKPLKYYTVIVKVVNDRSKPLEGAIVQIYNSNDTLVYSSVTLPDGTVTAKLLEGTYRVEVQAKGYLPNSVALSVPMNGELVVTLEPTNVTKAKRLIPYILILVGIALVAAVFYAVRDRIAKLLSEEEEYF